MDDSFVNLVVAGVKLRQPRGPADHQRQHTGRHRIERPQMPDLARPRQPPHLVDHVVRGPLARLVDNDHSVHPVKLTELQVGRLRLMFQDIRYAIRVLKQGRGVTAVAILAIALGIGANTTIFSVVNGVLLRPLPYRDPDRLVTLLQRNSNPLGAGDFVDVRAQAHSFEHIAAVEAWTASLTGREAPEDILGMRVTQDFFPMIGVTPIRGRTLDAGDFVRGKDHVLVIGYWLWQRTFAGAPDIVGRKVLLDTDLTPWSASCLHGFISRLFGYASRNVGSRRSDRQLLKRGGGALRGFARLATGVDRTKAQAEINQIAGGLSAAFPDTDTGIRWSSNPSRKKPSAMFDPRFRCSWEPSDSYC